MFFFPLTPKGWAARSKAKLIYSLVVDRSRNPVFYAELAVPDTLDGRFEMVALHTGLVIERVKGEGRDGQRLAQALFDEMFLNMEISCRQLGIGDLSVPRHIKRMMHALHGRAVTYDLAMKEGTLPAALRKNMYATVTEPSAEILHKMSAYIRACHQSLISQSFKTIAGGTVEFAPLPEGIKNVENSEAA